MRVPRLQKVALTSLLWNQMWGSAYSVAKQCAAATDGAMLTEFFKALAPTQSWVRMQQLVCRENGGLPSRICSRCVVLQWKDLVELPLTGYEAYALERHSLSLQHTTPDANAGLLIALFRLSRHVSYAAPLPALGSEADVSSAVIPGDAALDPPSAEGNRKVCVSFR